MTKASKSVSKAGPSNLAFTELLDSVPGAWFFTRRDGSFAYVSLGACEALGYSRQQLLASSVFDIDPTFDADTWSRLWESTVPNQSKVTRTRHRRRDGSEYPIEIRSLKIELDGEHLSASYSVDLTAAEQTRAALQETESRLERLINNLPDLVFRLRLEPRLTLEFLSPSCQSLLGYAAAELLDDEHAIARIVHAEDLGKFLSLPHLPAGTGSKLRFLHRAGRVVWMELRATLVEGTQGHAAILEGIARDVTHSHEAELANRRLSVAIEQAAEAVVVTDAQGNVEYVNPAYRHTSGLSEELAIGRPWRELEVRHDRAFLRRLERLFDHAEVWQGRIQSVRANGSAYDEDGTLAPIRDEAQRLVGAVAVKRDITEQLQLEEQLQRSHRLEMVGQLAGGIAHDFNNLLHIIHGHTQMMQLIDLQGFARAKDLTEMLHEVDKAAARAAVLVRQLLAFSRSDDGAPSELRLGELVASLHSLLQRLLGPQIQLVLRNDLTSSDGAGEVLVRGNRAQLEQVVTNLCLNARDALPSGGFLHISIDEPPREKLPAVLKSRIDESYVRLSVRDDGVGMTREVQRRLGEPFFTTKRPGEGVGLGLATVYAIVQSHRGFIDVSSARGKGSTFHVYLPRSDRSARREPSQPAKPSLEGRGRLVLVAENEPSMLQLTACYLKQAGFDVLIATSGPEAERIVRERGPELTLCVLDSVLPGFGGEGVRRVLRELGLPTPVLFVTGQASRRPEAAPEQEGVGLLHRPFGARELWEQAGRLLHEIEPEAQ
ncbi:MAG TPA: PAS domain S-box protein [Polyangiaceae bacterium]|nr:PAS domain S-box protein [Polyangiaceae bacterium]